MMSTGEGAVRLLRAENEGLRFDLELLAEELRYHVHHTTDETTRAGLRGAMRRHRRRLFDLQVWRKP